MAEDNEANYEKPSSQVDLERRLENDNRSSQVLVDSDEYNQRKADGDLEDTPGRDMRVEGNDISGYVGVDPVYQNYASDTEAPLPADEGAESKVFERVATEGDAVVQVSDELVSDEETKRATDETSKARPANVTTLSTPGSPATPGNVEPKESVSSAEDEGEVEQSGESGGGQNQPPPAQQPSPGN